MSDDNCALCTLQKDCTDVFLYATTPILRQIVETHLSAIGASFRSEREIFRISGHATQTVRELRNRLSEAERADIRATRTPGAALMAAPLLNLFDSNMDTSWFDEAVQNDAFTTYFQAIVDTDQRRVFAYECLIRLFTDRAYNGGEIMEAAISRGRVHLFDSYARRLSIRKAAGQTEAGTKTFINFLPSSIYDPVHCMRSTIEELAKTNMRPSDIVFEVVESEQITDVKHLRKICDYYRREKFGFALDDVGSGSNSFQMICDLEPDYIKLDKSLISKVKHPMYYSAIGKLSEFAHQYSLKVIAEGIEDEETMQKLKSLGVHLMQGYYFGKPAAQMITASNDLIQLASRLTGLQSHGATNGLPDGLGTLTLNDSR